MRKIILKWLLKEKEIKDYGDTLDKIRQLIEVCVKHGIDVDEELEV